jgi:D-glycero-alpha-D-manno-heptose-7-phosphate kinase
VSEDQQISIQGSYRELAQNTKLPLFALLFSHFWRADLPPITLKTRARSPAGAGLGGSSCLGIAIAAALSRAREILEHSPPLSEETLVRTVQDAEARLIHAPTGVQDYWGGIRGRVNVLMFHFGETTVDTYSPDSIRGLEDELILCYSGKSRASAINNWEIFKRLFDGDKELLRIFNQIGEMSLACAEAVRAHNLSEIISTSHLEWELRTKLWPAIETVETKAITKAALNCGARFTRVCGAGGGGVMAVFAPKDVRREVELAMTKAGGTILGGGIASSGLVIRHG